MATEWDMAAFAAALAIFVVPYIIKALKFLYEYLRRRRRRYVCLQWADIPQGRVYQCASQSAWHHSCFHVEKPHLPGNECWESASSLGSCFNRAWEISKRRPRYAKSIPEALPVGSQFLCTDARTVLAFAMCTVDKKKSLYWHARSLSFDNSRIEYETLRDGTAVVHIQGSIQHQHSDKLTKVELQRLLSGYPPWYRETFVTRANIELPFPISSERDIGRAGWIIAVGLMCCGANSNRPLALYRSPDEPENPKWRQNGRMFRQAVARCRDHIQENIAPHFPGSQDVIDAIVALNHMIDKLTGSGTPTGNLGLPERTSGIPHLRYADCKFVCDNFNEYCELDTSAAARFEPILFPVMAAAVHGAYEVVQYLKDVGTVSTSSGSSNMNRHHTSSMDTAASSTTTAEDDLIFFSSNDDGAPVVAPPVAPNDDPTVINSSNNRDNATFSYVKRTPPEMSLTRKTTQIWRDSEGDVPKFVEALFYIEHQGARLQPFKGLPAWAVPCPKDFNYIRHIGDDKQDYYMTKRLQVKIEIDPSPQRLWVKPLLDNTMVNWLGNDFRRLDAVKKLWEAYDFLCFWSVEAAKRDRALPLHKALNVYYEKSILNYRTHVHEMMSSYEGEGEEGRDAAVLDIKGDGADEDSANVGITAEEKGKGKGKMKEESSYNSVAEKVEWENEDNGGIDSGTRNPISTNNPSRSIPVASTTHEPLRNAAFTRPRFDKPWVPASRAASHNIPPLVSSPAPQTRSEHRLGTPIAASTPKATVDPTRLSTWRRENPASVTNPEQQHFASPQDAILWINKQATSAVVNYQSSGPNSEPPAYVTFESWAAFFEQQLLSHDTEPRFDNPWFSTEKSLQQFIRALHDVFQEEKKSTEFSSELREWALAVNRKLEDRKRERDSQNRVATILGRTMAGIAQEKLFEKEK
ncbi:hypothetical protein F4776DRAFT_671640 [Hypoxylon sp. NC0597]|nr:hypothetical protein F4776DRAFT_671640 [Hypoxylon sp. NC0597]